MEVSNKQGYCVKIFGRNGSPFSHLKGGHLSRKQTNDTSKEEQRKEEEGGRRETETEKEEVPAPT